MKPLNIDNIIADPDSYDQAIRKVFDKKNESNQAFAEAHEGVSYIGTFMQHRSLARALAATVGKGDYQCSPVKLWFLKLKTKTRQAHLPTYTDQIVGSVVYRVVSENAQFLGMPGLYSYLPGTSNFTAMQDFSRHVRQYRRRVKNPRERGLYVLQSDFEKYGDNLPVHPEAYIWKKLRDVIGAGVDGPISDNAWNLVESLVRPVVRDSDGSEFVRLYGIPTGVPIVPMVNNLAVTPLDELLANWDGAFYARFNDDFIFVHPDRSAVLDAEEKLTALLSPLGVRRNKLKDIHSYFNGAGRRCDEDPRFRGSSRIDFLGLSVSFEGIVAAGPARVARFMTEVCKRLDRSARALEDLPFDDKVGRLVNVTNRMLAPGHPLSVPGAAGIIRDTTDRDLLKSIDRHIARKLVQVATAQPGVRGLRRLPIQALRDRWELTSLVKVRNSL